MPKKVSLESIDKKIDQKFEEVDSRFEKVDRRFDFIDKRLNDHDTRLDNISQATLDLLDDMKDVKENMVIKKDLDEINNTLDKQTVILIRIDQERIFTLERVRGLEKDVLIIKQNLGIS